MNREEREKIRKQLRIKFVSETLHALSFHETCDLVNYSSMEIGELRSQLTTTLAERNEARERVKELLNQNCKVWAILNGAGLCGSTQEEVEDQLLHYANVDARVDAIVEEAAAQLDTAWQQGAEAFREAAAEATDKKADSLTYCGNFVLAIAFRAAVSDIRALPVPERKEG